MEIKNVTLENLKIADKFLLSFPLKPQFYHELRQKFANLPFIIVNKENEIIFGIDYYRFLKSNGIAYADVLRMDIADKEALFLNYNSKEKLTGLNLYEKLVFIKKVLFLVPLEEKAEIYRWTNLDIDINRELVDKLDLLLSTEFRSSLVNESISLKSGLTLCDFQSDDRDILLGLFAGIPFSSSHQLKVLEMVEEILFRDKCTMAEVFERLNIDRYMELERPQKAIIDAFFKYRNPIYMESEAKWEEEMKRLNLPGNIKVTHYPFFEKKDLELTVQLKDGEEFKRLIEKLKG
jgi:hypothetical protein